VDDRNRVSVTWGQHRTIMEEFLLRWARLPPPMPDGRGYVSGAAMLVPRSTFLELGGFDENFFMYYEDIDFCWRANTAEIPVTVEPAWRVRHSGGHAASRDRGRALIRSYDSASYFFAKHGENIVVYRLLCRIDAWLKLAVFSMLPQRRNTLHAIRQLSAHIAKASPMRVG
jgi:GT2 family glycosyltransferase